MERKPIFTGAASALITPMTSSGVDYENFEKLIADKCLGDNYYYSLPSIGMKIPSEPMLPRPPSEKPFR